VTTEILIGSREGVYRATADSESADLALEGVETYGLAATGESAYAAAVEGLYRSEDGESWKQLDVPTTPVSAVAVRPDGGRVYAGTMPARIYASDDRGERWTELAGFQDVPSRPKWYNRDLDVHVRSLGVHPDAPDRVVAGVDGGGVHVSDEEGVTWAERLSGVPQYVHEVLVCEADEFVAATDAGLYRTADAGRWWDFLHDDDLKHRYFRGAVRQGETVYAGGARSHPPTWWAEGGADAALYEVDFSVDERRPRITPVPYPGEPDELVLGGVTAGDRVVMGTTRGRLLEVTAAGDVGTALSLPVESEIRALAAWSVE
jgi:hypothetical protein